MKLLPITRYTQCACNTAEITQGWNHAPTHTPQRHRQDWFCDSGLSIIFSAKVSPAPAWIGDQSIIFIDIRSPSIDNFAFGMTASWSAAPATGIIKAHIPSRASHPTSFMLWDHHVQASPQRGQARWVLCCFQERPSFSLAFYLIIIIQGVIKQEFCLHLIFSDKTPLFRGAERRLMLNKSCIPQIQCTWHSYLISICGYANVQCLSNLINLLLRQSENMNQSWATSAGSGQGDERLRWKHCFMFLPSFGTHIQTKTLPLLRRQQKAKVKKKEKEKKNYRGIITKISAAPPKTNQSWFRVWTKYLQPEFPNCPSCRLVLWFTGGWQGAGRRATRFPDCSIVKSFFSLPTWKALNNVYKMLGNPGRFPI